MRITLFSSKPYDRDSFAAANANAGGFDLHFLDARLDVDTAALAAGSTVVCAFVNDDLSAPVLERLAQAGTRLIALRSAGYNHVDLHAAARLGLPVVVVRQRKCRALRALVASVGSGAAKARLRGMLRR